MEMRFILNSQLMGFAVDCGSDAFQFIRGLATVFYGVFVVDFPNLFQFIENLHACLVCKYSRKKSKQKKTLDEKRKTTWHKSF